MQFVTLWRVFALVLAAALRPLAAAVVAAVNRIYAVWFRPGGLVAG